MRFYNDLTDNQTVTGQCPKKCPVDKVSGQCPECVRGRCLNHCNQCACSTGQIVRTDIFDRPDRHTPPFRGGCPVSVRETK